MNNHPECDLCVLADTSWREGEKDLLLDSWVPMSDRPDAFAFQHVTLHHTTIPCSLSLEVVREPEADGKPERILCYHTWHATYATTFDREYAWGFRFDEDALEQVRAHMRWVAARIAHELWWPDEVEIEDGQEWREHGFHCYARRKA